MKAKGCTVHLDNNDPGFTLPSTIGELGDITALDLSRCSLRGAHFVSDFFNWRNHLNLNGVKK